MASGFNSGRTLGTVLMITGAALAIVAVAWLGVNAASGDLEPGGFVLGLFFLMLFILPLLLVGYYIRQRGAAEAVQESTFEDRCRLFERDRITRQTLRREATRAATVVGARLGQLEGESADLLRQTQQTLDGLAEGMAQPVAEADWLHAASLSAQDVRDKERYDDLLLAGLRRHPGDCRRQRPHGARYRQGTAGVGSVGRPTVRTEAGPAAAREASSLG